MNKIILLILIFQTICFLKLQANVLKTLEPLNPSEDYTHKLFVDEDRPEQYQVFWKLLKDEEIQFEVHCKTTGWVGMGLSPNGGMGGSDIVIGWVKDNKPYLKDCYAQSKSPPIIDTQQDYMLIDGAEINGYTILKFKRKLITCDQQNDKTIKIGTEFMIFAWNDADPINNDWQYHGTKNRIQRTLMLLTYKDESLDQQNVLPSDTFIHTIRMTNLKVPAKDTYYYCDLYPLPQFDKPTHMLQYEIIVNEKNKAHLHHLVAYECEDDYTPQLTLAKECGIVWLPEEVSRNCMQKVAIAWGIGGEHNYSFPKQAGYRFDPSPKAKYLLIEMHYDNPDLKADIIDDSGVKLYFTHELRQHDLGFVMLGVDGNFLSLQIPPKSSNSVFTAICYPECTEKYFPEDGIYAVSGFLHTHLAGRSVKTTLVRNDVAIQELFENPNYDFNYQFVIDIEPTKILPGDALITTCKYETNDRDHFTFFGFGTKEEMCYDFIYYYPKLPDFLGCMSITHPKALFNFYRTLINESLIPSIELNETTFDEDQFELMDFFQTKVKSSPKLVKRFEDFFSSPYNKTVYCGNPRTDNNIYKENVLHYTPKESILPNGDICNNKAEILSPNFIMILSLFLIICNKLNSLLT